MADDFVADDFQPDNAQPTSDWLKGGLLDPNVSGRDKLSNLLVGPKSDTPILGPGLMKIPGIEAIAERIKNKGISTGNWWAGAGASLLSDLISGASTAFDPRTAFPGHVEPIMPHDVMGGKLNINPSLTTVDEALGRAQQPKLLNPAPDVAPNARFINGPAGTTEAGKLYPLDMGPVNPAMGAKDAGTILPQEVNQLNQIPAELAANRGLSIGAPASHARTNAEAAMEALIPNRYKNELQLLPEPATPNNDFTIGDPNAPYQSPTALKPINAKPEVTDIPEKPIDLINNEPSIPHAPIDTVLPKAGQAKPVKDITGFTANFTSPDQTLSKYEWTKPIADVITTANDEKMKWIASTERELADLTGGLGKQGRKLLGMAIDGKLTDTLPPDIQARATKAREILDSIHAMFPEGAKRGGEDVGYLENYFTHLAEQPDDIKSGIKTIVNNHFKIFTNPNELSDLKTLYRWESEKGSGVPGWVKNSPEYKSSQEASGKWFTNDINDIDFYKKDSNGKGKLITIQVTPQEFENSRVVNNKTALKYSASPETEHFFDKIPISRNSNRGIGDAFDKSLGNPSSPFIKERTGGLTNIDYDVHKVFPAYVESAAKVIFDKPAVDAARESLKDVPEGNLKEMATWYIKNYSNYDSLPGLHRAWNDWASTIARTTARSLLGFNTGIQTLHLARIPANLWPELGTKYTVYGLKEIGSHPIQAWQEAAKLGLLQGEIRPFAFKTPMEKFDSISNFLSVADYLDKAAGYHGFKKKFLDAGMHPDEASLAALKATKKASLTTDMSRQMKGFSPESNFIGGEAGSKLAMQFKQIPYKIVEQFANIASNAKKDPMAAARMVSGVGLAAAIAESGMAKTFHISPTQMIPTEALGATGQIAYNVARKLAKGDVVGALGEVGLWAIPGGKSLERQIEQGPSALNP